MEDTREAGLSKSGEKKNVSRSKKQNKPKNHTNKKRGRSLPGVVRLVAVLLLPLALPSHLLQLLPVFPLDEALLMSHLREVICSREETPSQTGGKIRQREREE